MLPVTPISCEAAINSPILQKVVRVESSGNPFAIGIVRDRLVRQPKTLEEAVATAKQLHSAGYNFSIGKGQVNKVHFKRLGWDTDISKGFDKCANLSASAEIYMDCHNRALAAGYPMSTGSAEQVQRATYTATHAALSCYYSGDFLLGAKLGYVDKVLGGKSTVLQSLSQQPTNKTKPQASSSMMLYTNQGNENE